MPQDISSGNQDRPKRDHDNDRFYRRPRAWANAKKAFGCGIAVQMEAIEKLAGEGSAREELYTAIEHWLNMKEKDRTEAWFARCRRSDLKRGHEAVVERERNFIEAMRKLGFTDDDAAEGTVSQ